MKCRKHRSHLCALRAFALGLSVLLLLPLLASCGGKEDPAGEEGKLDVPFTVSGSSWTVEATHLDCEAGEGAVVVYTRAYQRDGAPAVTVEAEQGRTVLCVGSETSGGETTYTVLAMTNGEEEEAAFLPIPYNGFVLSIPATALGDARVRTGQKLEVTGGELLGEPERRNAGTFRPSGAYGSALERRILYRDPVAGLQGEGVYFLSAAYTAEQRIFPAECSVAALTQSSGGGYRVETLSDRSDAAIGQDQLVFYGAYERAYAKTFLSEGASLTLSHPELASPYSDVEALVIGETVYRIPASAQNCAQIAESGVYLTDARQGRVSTPEAAVDRVDVVVLNETVVYIGEKNARSMLPLAGGVAFTFAGENAAAAEALRVGQEVQTVLLDTQALPDQFVRIGEQVYAIDKIDAVRSPEGVTVLYTPEYGATTGANRYGVEIAIADGKVTEIQRDKGDISIPENGYVLSIHKDSENYSKAIRNARVGDDATVSLGKGNYSVSTLAVSGINALRGEDMLIIYRSRGSTGTNPYGYEIQVDADGKMIGDGYFGNIEVPKGGFVLSGHGVNKDALEICYRYGAQVQFDEETMTVALFTTPETVFTDLAFRLDSVVQKLDDAKAHLLDLDYGTVEQTVEELTSLSETSVQALRSGDFDTALSGAEKLEDSLKSLQYALIETHAVENRAVWYRSNEKSDDEVRATVERMKELNINAVYLESWYNGRFTGYSDNQLIAHTTANGDYDVLEGFVRIAHENGIEVHAWVENFFIGTVEAQEQANKALSEHFAGRWLTDCKGKNTYFYSVSSTNFIFMNPYDREVRTFLLDFYREIVTKYDVDGIHLDYIRFPELNYGKDDFGYNEDIVSAWKKQQGTDVDPATLTSGALYDSWVLFRQEIINSFVAEVSGMLRKTKPSVSLSAAVYPQVSVVKSQIFQDCGNWVKNGYVDELYSMSYGEDNRYVSENAAMFAGIAGDACFYSTGISGFGETTQENFALQMAEVISAGADGVAIFAFPNITQTYTQPVRQGAFRTPSVQVTRLSETVAAQLGSILNRTDSVFAVYAGLTKEQCDSIRSLLQPILDEANAFDPANATAAEKSAYCERTIGQIAAAKEEILPFFANGTQRSAIRGEFENLEHWLTVSMNRWNTRK